MKNIACLFLIVYTHISVFAQLQLHTNAVHPNKNFDLASYNSQDAVTGATDTLEYFFNKHYFRNPTAANANLNFLSLNQPYNGTISITHCGGIFLNTNTITVHGLEGIVIKNATAPTPSVPVRLYLCALNGANMPILPALDSVQTSVSSTTIGVWVGGNFINPITVTGNFAVLYRNVSTNPNDTIRLFLNNACTPSSTFTPARKFGEGFGRMRYMGNFISNTNTFGTGTDLEFIVAPRVSFSYTAGIAATTNTACTNSNAVFMNTSSTTALIQNRQFNFNKFAAYWPPFNNLIPSTDSIYKWTFTGSSTGTLFTTNALASFNVPGIQTASLTVKYRKSASNAAFNSTYTDIATASISISNLNSPTLSINGAGVICSGGSATLTASGNITYTWTNPISNAASIVVSPTATTVYTVLGVNGGCTGSQTATVTVSQPSQLSVSGPSAVCLGAIFNMSASGANSYTWSNGANTASTSASSSIAGVQSFTCIGANAPCPASNAVLNIMVNPLPNVTLSYPSASLCTKSTGGSTLQLNGTPAGGIYTGANVVNGVFSPNTSGTFISSYSYTDQVTGCAKTVTASVTVVNCTGLEETEHNTFNIIPNPSLNGQVILKNLSIGGRVEIWSIYGQRILIQGVDQSELKINLSEYPEGTYIALYYTPNGVKHTKWITR